MSGIASRAGRLGWGARSARALTIGGCAALLWLASGVGIPGALTRASGQIQGMVTVFLGIYLEALPFLLAGVIASAAIDLYMPDRLIQRLSPRSPALAALVGTVLGLIFPVCECGSVPMARRLMQKGAPPALGVAFVLATPVVNPIVIASTWVAFSGRPDIVAARIVATIIIAGATGLIVARALPHGALLEREAAPQQRAGGGRGAARLLSHASGEFFEMGRYLVAGALIAAALQAAIPRASIAGLAGDPILSVLAMMGLAAILSVCSTVDAFIALAFAGAFPSGALLAFLVFGPMIDLKSVLMLRTTFQARAVAWIVLVTTVLSLAAGVALNMLGGGG